MISNIYFEILGITQTATPDEIKKGYKDQLKLWHPDKCSNDITKIQEATERTQKINEAYNLLKKHIPKQTTSSFKNSDTKAKAKSSQNEFSKDTSRIKVKSSNVYAIGYDLATRILQVEFRNGSLYEYYDVPEAIFVAFLNAESKGRFIGKLYKYNYRCVRDH